MPNFDVQHQADPRLVPDTQIVVSDRLHADKNAVVEISARDSGNYGYDLSGANKVIRFDIASSHEALILADSALEFDCVLSAGTTGVLDGSAHSLINRIRVLTKNGVVIEDRDQYNLQYAIESCQSMGAESASKQWTDISDNLGQAEASKLDMATSRRVVLTPNMSLFKFVRALHLPITGALVMEVYLEKDNNAFSSGNTGLEYKITNPVFRAHMIPLESSHIDKLFQVAKSGKLVYHVPQVYHTSNTFANASDSININYKVASARDITAVWRLSTDENTLGNKWVEKFQYLAGLSSLQLQNSSDRYPTIPFSDPEQVYFEMLKANNEHNDVSVGSQITRTRYTAADANDNTCPLFMYKQNLLRAGSHTGVDTSNALVLKATYNGVANTQIDCFVAYDATFSVLSPNQALMTF